MSHPYMTPNVEGHLPRSTPQEILEEGHGMVNYVVDVLSACHIVDIA